MKNIPRRSLKENMVIEKGRNLERELRVQMLFASDSDYLDSPSVLAKFQVQNGPENVPECREPSNPCTAQKPSLAWQFLQANGHEIRDYQGVAKYIAGNDVGVYWHL